MFLLYDGRCPEYDIAKPTGVVKFFILLVVFSSYTKTAGINVTNYNVINKQYFTVLL